MSSFGKDWERIKGDITSLRDKVMRGKAFIPAAMISGHRNSAAFDHADLAVVDIDNGLTVD